MACPREMSLMSQPLMVRIFDGRIANVFYWPCWLITVWEVMELLLTISCRKVMLNQDRMVDQDRQSSFIASVQPNIDSHASMIERPSDIAKQISGVSGLSWYF